MGRARRGALPPDRELRPDRRPPHGRAGGPRRLHRLVLPCRFDSPSLFAAILDADNGGRFRIAPEIPCASKQFYLPDTAILVTRFFSPQEGVAEVTDFMPVGLEPCAIVRRVDVVRGSVGSAWPAGRASTTPARDHRVTADDPRVARFTADGGATRARVEPAPADRRPRAATRASRSTPARGRVRAPAGRRGPALGGRPGTRDPRRHRRLLARWLSKCTTTAAGARW